MFALFVTLCVTCSVLFVLRKSLPVDVLKLGLSTLQVLTAQPVRTSSAVLMEQPRRVNPAASVIV
jgi:hypothetical protein